MPDARILSTEALEEAAALAAYASESACDPTIESIEAGLDDSATTHAVLSVAEHVADLRGQWSIDSHPSAAPAAPRIRCGRANSSDALSVC